jgi:hypothetical protein
MPGYAAYLRSQAWAHRKAEALERAGRRCQVCGHDRRLDVHHNTYERIGAELPGDLVVLCALCHTMYHAQRPKPPGEPPAPEAMERALAAYKRAVERTGGKP